MTPKIRQTLYAVGTVATAILGVLSLWRVIDPATANHASAAVAALLSLLGVGAAGTAAVVTNKQRAEGMFDQQATADLVVGAVQAVIEAKQHAEEEANRVAEAVAGLTREVPVLGPLASQILDQIRK